MNEQNEAEELEAYEIEDAEGLVLLEHLVPRFGALEAAVDAVVEKAKSAWPREPLVRTMNRAAWDMLDGVF